MRAAGTETTRSSRDERRQRIRQFGAIPVNRPRESVAKRVLGPPTEGLARTRVVAEHARDLGWTLRQRTEVRLDRVTEHLEDHRGEVAHRDLLPTSEIEQ